MDGTVISFTLRHCSEANEMIMKGVCV